MVTLAQYPVWLLATQFQYSSELGYLNPLFIFMVFVFVQGFFLSKYFFLFIPLVPVVTS